MASNSTVARYRPAIAILAALAAGYTVYYIHSTRQASRDSPAGSQRLRRSNAVIRRRSRRRDERPREASEYPRSVYNAHQLLETFRVCPDSIGVFRFPLGGTDESGFPSPNGIPLSPKTFPPLDQIKELCRVDDDGAEDIRQRYEAELMKAFLCKRLPPNSVLEDAAGPEAYVTAFEEEEFMFADSILNPITQFNCGIYEHLPERRAAYASAGIRPPVRRRLRPESSETDNNQDHSSTPPPAAPPFEEEVLVEGFALQSSDMDVDDESEQSWNPEENDESRREGQSLLNLLYHIAEDQARREGIVHRGVSCNSCNATPIKGIRYRCTNCVDYDLCEQCESMQFHQKNHLFIKIRVPTPSHSSSRRPQPVWYPGNAIGVPNNLPRELNKSLTEESGFSDNEVDAMWDQFKNLAVATWADDPDEIGWAIDREAFDKCFIVSPEATRTPPAALIYDRTFAFYDSNRDGLIGFREFVVGLSAARSKNPDERHKRTFNGFDYDDDGYVSRRDLLLMFRSHYALQREFTRELVSEMEADLLEGGDLRQCITGNQPISAAYHGSFLPSRSHHAGEGKQQDANGDLTIVDNGGVIAEDATDEGELDQVIGDLHEIAKFGNLQDEDLATPRGTRPAEVASTEFSTQEGVLDAAYSDSHWPPPHVADHDVERALGQTVALGDITNEVDRSKILKAAANRMKAEEERPKRQQIRDSALRDRLNRRQFYLDDEQKVLDSQAIQRQASQTVRNAAAVHATQGLASNEQSGEPTADHSLPAKVGRSTKSSAQLQTQTSDRYREPPPLPKNPGQEILFQITQESINELLDPMFKLREDLAMENINLVPFYAQFEKHLLIFRRGKMDDLCRVQINRLQDQWRKAEEDFTLGYPIAAVVQNMILNQGDKSHEEYPQNLLDMYHVGMIDKETLDQQLNEGTGKNKPRVEVWEEEFTEQPPTQPFTEHRVDQSSSQLNRGEVNGSTQEEFPAAALDLSRNVEMFNEAGTSIEEMVRAQSLPGLLDSAGYAIVEERPDPTLPQNRPNAVLDPTERPKLSIDPNESLPMHAVEAASVTYQDTRKPLTNKHPWTHISATDEDQWTGRFRRFLKYMTMMDIVRQEDKQRDGPGKLSRSEYEDIVKGRKGASLAFLGHWIDFHAL